MLRQFFALSLCICLSFATYGVDVSQLYGVSTWSCLVNAGYSFAIVRCYRSTGEVDSNCAANVANAWAGGMSHVDVYMFPCVSCGDPADQVSTLISYLSDNSVKYGQIWFDIEGSDWYDSVTDNQNFLYQMGEEAYESDVDYGIYTSASQWNPIMGGWTGASALPLWYAHYDDYPGFSDFSAFGGWTEPSMKQYEGDATVCGAGIDKNYYPSWK